MKKGLLYVLLLFITSILYIPSAFAINFYSNVLFTAYFEEDVDVSKLNNIIIEYTDSTEKLKKLVLSKENNYTLNIDNIPIGDINVFSVLEENDIYGYYKMTPEIVPNIDSTIKVNIYIGLQNNIKNEITINDSIKQSVLTAGVNNKTTTTNAINSETTIDKNANDTNSDIKEDLKTTSTTKTLSLYDKTVIEQKEREKEKQKNIKQNNKIGMILYTIIGIIFIIIILFVFVKVINANK